MGYKLKEAREEARMTQEELERKSGISRATICALESGREKNVTVQTLLKIADALGKRITDIFFDEAV